MSKSLFPTEILVSSEEDDDTEYFLVHHTLEEISGGTSIAKYKLVEVGVTQTETKFIPTPVKRDRFGEL